MPQLDASCGGPRPRRQRRALIASVRSLLRGLERQRVQTRAQVKTAIIEEIVSRCTPGIDPHTGARHRANFPQIRDGSLRECAGGRGIPVILYEAGEALRFKEMYARAGGRENAVGSAGEWYGDRPDKSAAGLRWRRHGS